LRINRDLFQEYETLYNLQDNVLYIRLDGIWYLLNSESVRSVYFRAPVFLRTTGKARSIEEQLKRSQWSAFIRNLIILDKAMWMNHPVATYCAENKLYQLKVARECGLAVPETYVGNSLPQNISPDCMYIVKSLDTALFYENGKEMFTYSTMIEGKELLSAEIQLAPVIIQECLSPKIDLRVTVVENHIFPVAITKQGIALEGDWRKSNKDNLTYTPVELPQIINEQLMLLMKKLKLSFGGIDLALVGDTYYFIEVNPTGEWGWLTSSAGLSIDKAIVDALVC
jgi:glutathione synthase/RimK-type ligase-like ATP-grasp enzyme